MAMHRPINLRGEDIEFFGQSGVVISGELGEYPGIAGVRAADRQIDQLPAPLDGEFIGGLLADQFDDAVDDVGAMGHFFGSGCG